MRTPRLCALFRVGPEAIALATETDGGTPLADLGGSLTEEELEAVGTR